MSKLRKIKILFDANPMVNGNKSGVGYYTYNLIDALASNYPNDIELVGHYFSFLGKKDGADLPKAPNITYVRSRLIPGKILSVTRMLGLQPPLELFFRTKGDVALFTNFVSLPSTLNTPTLVTVHDLCFEDVPEYVAEKNRKFLHRFVPQAIKKSRKVLTISKSTQKAIQDKYGTAPEKFIVLPIPPEEHRPLEKVDLGTMGIQGKYILFVGTLEPRKNIIGLVKAYDALPKEIKQKYGLVLAGGNGWYIDETLDYIKTLQQAGNNIILTGYITDAQKSALYRSADLFVLPSHYEGFGMPILEAMSYGVPTAVSNIDVFHEVSGNASAYFDHKDPEAIARSISKLLTNQELLTEYAEKGKKRAASYSWPEVAKTLYNNLITLKNH